MHRILRLLGTRYGIALVLGLIVLGIVGVTRGLAGQYRSAPVVPVTEPSRSSIDPTAGNDSILDPDVSPPAPSTSPGAASPETVAGDFIRGWLNHVNVSAEQWRASFAKYATASLRDKLKNTDPLAVPAQRTTGPVRVQSRDATLVEAVVPVDSGTVRLRMLASDGRWLVDGIDWERS